MSGVSMIFYPYIGYNIIIPDPTSQIISRPGEAARLQLSQNSDAGRGTPEAGRPDTTTGRE